MAALRLSIVSSFQLQEESLALLAYNEGLHFETARLKLVNGLLRLCDRVDLAVFADDWISECDFIVRLVVRVEHRVYLHGELLIKVLT